MNNIKWLDTLDQGNTFQRRTYGRIFVARAEDIPKVNAIIKWIDPFEYEYMPDDLITTFHPDAMMIYLHKFEASKDVIQAHCFYRNIWVWCVDGKEDGWRVRDALKLPPDISETEPDFGSIVLS